jgi:hypothetical protein
MPDRLVIPGPGQRSQGLLQQPGEPAEVPGSAGTAFRLQLGRIAEPGDQVRIGVLVRPTRPVEVVQQAADVPAAEHFPNHRNTCPEVHDHGTGRPVRRRTTADDEQGRGLELFDGLIDLNGGVRGVVDDTDGPGKTVYVALSLDPSQAGTD